MADIIGALVIAVVLAAGIPSTIFSVMLNRYFRRMDERDAARVQKELLDYRAHKAHFALSGECAKSIIKLDPEGRTHNGDLQDAREFSQQAKHEQEEFWVKEGARK